MQAKKNLKEKRKTIKVNPYGLWVVIDFCPELYTSKFIPLDKLDQYSACCVYPEVLGFSGKSDPDVIMAFFDYNTNLLAHECVHASYYILDKVGVEISKRNDEALAYMVGWLAQEVNKFAYEVKIC